MSSVVDLLRRTLAPPGKEDTSRTCDVTSLGIDCNNNLINKKHLKNVGPIHHCEPPHAHSPDVASGTVASRLRIDVHDNADDNDNDDNP